MHSDAGNLKPQVGTSGPSLKPALKPNADVLNALHYFNARCNGETHANMLELPSEHSLPHKHIHTPLPYLKQDSSFWVLEQSLTALQPCVVTAVKLTVPDTLSISI